MTNAEYANSGEFRKKVRLVFIQLCKHKDEYNNCAKVEDFDNPHNRICSNCADGDTAVSRMATTRQASKFRMGRGIVHKLATT